jgi:hypothetical protein
VIGVLGKVLRRLEEYRSLRAADPRAPYNDLSVAREIWPEVEGASDGEAASATGNNREAPSDEGNIAAEHRGVAEGEVNA